MMWIYIKHENNETSKPSFIYDSIVLCEQDALGGLRVSTESVSDGFFLLKGGDENILGLAKDERAKRDVARELVFGADK
jgi:hypothetical protein